MTIPLAFGQSCTPGEEVEFDASASKPDPSKIKIYKWDFESDGKVDETGSRVRHAFDTTDWTYTITFTIEDDIGQTASTKTTIKPIHHTSPQPEPAKDDPSEPAKDDPSAPPGGRCLIATAAFGSELAPQVQFLRNFRDQHIMSTSAGSSFMSVFNIWYYSFSPYVADYERGQPWLQNTVKTSIYPLIAILQTSEKANSSIDGEYGAVAAGFVASFMIGALYFWPFAISIRRVRTNRFNYKLALTMIVVVFVGIISSLASGNEYALMVSTSLFVLTIVSVSAVLSAKLIVTVFNTVGSMMAKGDVRSRV